MHKKGSMELSVNSIVILVIAVVMMGLILGFIRSKFSSITTDLEREEPEPPAADISNPISLSRINVITGTGTNIALKASVYNGESFIMTDAYPQLVCNDPKVGTVTVKVFLKDFTSTGAIGKKTIAVGSIDTFTGTLKTGNVPKDVYLCQIKITGKKDTTSTLFTTSYSKEFTVEIR